MAVVARATEDLPRLGILMMLAAWLLFSLVDTGAKWLAVAGIPAFQLAFMRYAGHFAVSVAMIARGGLSADRFDTAHRWQVISRAVLLVSATLCNFYALAFLPLTVVSAIMFSSPVIVCFLTAWLLKEQIGAWRISAILLGFIGVLIVVRPFGNSFHPAMLLIIYNATAMAFYSIMTRKLAGIVATETLQFYMGLVGTVTLLPFAVWSWTAPGSPLAWAVLCGMGFVAWAGHQLLTNAHRFGTANTLMPFTYSFMIYVSIWGYLIFGNLPDTATLTGAVVIILAGLIIWKREGK